MFKVLISILALVVVSQGKVLNARRPRIIDGDRVKPGEIPFIVSLQQNDGLHFCGGSILNKDWILTAAHCVSSLKPSSVKVVAGTTDHSKPGQKREVDSIIPHEDWNSRTIENDIALIKVKSPFEFNALVAPAALPGLHQKTKTNTAAVVSGWGNTGLEKPNFPTDLYKAEIYVTSLEFCREVLEKEDLYKIHDTQICAYHPTIRRGSCNRDSGGPLAADGQVIGIVSWGKGDPYCGSTKYPEVYTKVSEYINWITETQTSH